MDTLTAIFKELVQPLLQQAQGAAIIFIFFATGLIIPHLVPALMAAHPILGTVLIAALIAAATYGIVRLQRTNDQR